MFPLSVCLLTCDSERLLREVLNPLTRIADELIVVDSGSRDETLNICRTFGITPLFRSYATHAEQMNFAIGQARHDWVLCMDSDEILDEQTLSEIAALKAGPAPDPGTAFRIVRHWFVLGEPVRTIYPVSSPDHPVRLFHRQHARFNGRPVDDAVEGFKNSRILAGAVRHDTFYSLHEVFNKLNSYTTRLVQHKEIAPSLFRAITSPIGAFGKWYFLSGAWRYGKVGIVTGVYAALYSFLKYFKAWYANGSGERKR